MTRLLVLFAALLGAAATATATALPQMHLHSYQGSPLAAPPQAPQGWALEGAQRAANRSWLVYLPGLPASDSRAILEKRGLRVEGYLPDRTWLVSGEESRLTSLATAMSEVWYGPLEPWYKLRPAFGQRPYSPQISGRPQVAVRFHSTLSTAQAAAALSRLKLEAAQLSAQPWPWAIVDVPEHSAADLREFGRRLAHLPEVLWVEEEFRRTADNNDAAWVLQGGYTQGGAANQRLYQQGLRGEGQVVAILDSGLKPDSCFFWDEEQGFPTDTVNLDQRKVIWYEHLWPQRDWDSDSHGSHVAGTVAGDQLRPGVRDDGDGIAPAAKLAIHDNSSPADSFAVPSDLYAACERAYKAGARAHSNSWSADINLYTVTSQQTDQFVYDNPDFLILFSASNAGPAKGSLGTSGNGKNTLAIGAHGNGWDANNMASFSSHGPAEDGRMKPDISAPGVRLSSAATDYDIFTFTCNQSIKSGTSMSCPAAAGASALVRQYLAERRKLPLGVPEKGEYSPSAAMLRAMLVASTESMNGAYTADDGSGGKAAPSFGQGWGRVNLDQVLEFPEDERNSLLADNPRELRQGQVWETTVWVASPEQDFKVVLSWTDPPAVGFAAKQLVSDLDLEVVGWDGNITYGNHQLAKGPDTLNTTEVLWFSRPVPGEYRIRVRARELPQGNQGFALVAVGDFVDRERLVLTDKRCRSFTAYYSITEWQGGAVPSLEYGIHSVPMTPLGRLASRRPVVFQAQVSWESQPGRSTPPGVVQVSNSSLQESFIPDCVAPTFRDVRVTNISNTGAIVRWRSSEPTSSIVQYQPGEGFATNAWKRSSVGGLRTEHAVFLGELEPETAYHFTVGGADGWVNSQQWPPLGWTDSFRFQFTTRRVDILFYDDFTSDLGWEEAGDGQWERARPRGLGGDFFRNADPAADHTGDQDGDEGGVCIGTDLTADGLYAPNTSADIITPWVDCTQARGTLFGFWRQLNVRPSPGQLRISAQIAIQRRSDAEWQTFFNLNEVADLEWVYRQYDVSSVADGHEVRFRFRLECSDQSQPQTGWNVDDVIVFAYPAGQRTETGVQFFPPRVGLAGYMDTRLRAGQEGTLRMLAVVAGEPMWMSSPSGLPNELFWQGLPTGVRFQPQGGVGSGVYEASVPGLRFSGAQEVLLDFGMVEDGNLYPTWPWLVVE